MNILDAIEKKHYIATDTDVEQLAASHFNSDALTKRSDGQYLRILVAAMKAKFGHAGTRGRKRAMTEAEGAEQSEYLAITHTRFYAAVLKGVTTEDVQDDEKLSVDERRARAGIRNGRAAFARSSASTLQSFLRNGGDVRTLVTATVTKSDLRKFVTTALGAGTSQAVQAVTASVKRMTRDVEALAEADPDAARLAIDEAMAQLQGIAARLAFDARATLTQAAAATVPTETQVFRQKTRARFAGQRRAA